MCDLVEEYAKEYAKEFADEERIKLTVSFYNDGSISSDVAARKLKVTEEQFMEFVEKYTEQ